jgi:hypothetical protein
MTYHPSFSQLADRFGEIAAWHYLVEIEKAAGIYPQQHIADPEARLTNALRIQDGVQESTTQMAA